MTKLQVGVSGVGGIAKTHMPGWDESPYTEVLASSDIASGILDMSCDTIENQFINNLHRCHHQSHHHNHQLCQHLLLWFL